MATLEDDLQGRISSQVEDFKSLKMHSPAATLERLYWREEGGNTYGILSNPLNQSEATLISELLFTPRLIVDIWDVPANKFIALYGVSYTQMMELCERGYVKPNIYKFRNDGWRSYLKFPQVAEILARHGVPNSEFIRIHLDTNKEAQILRARITEAILQSPFSETVREQILARDSCRSGTWATFADVHAQRVAYLPAFGGPDYAPFAHRIGELFEQGCNPENAIELLELLDPLKHATSTKNSAAFGGKFTLPLADHEQFCASVPEIRYWTGDLNVRLEPPRPRGALRYAQALADRSLRRQGSGSRRLSSKHFDMFLKDVLENVRDGKIASFVDSMTNQLMQSGTPTDLTAYREIERAIDQTFKVFGWAVNPLHGLAHLINDIGEHQLHQYKWSGAAFCCAGLGVTWMAKKLEHAELLLPGKKPFSYQIYGEWRAVKQALRLEGDVG